MSITMIPQPSGMVLPRCAVCGKDIFCKDMATDQQLSSQPNGDIRIKPLSLPLSLVGQGLGSDDLTCSSCLLNATMRHP